MNAKWLTESGRIVIGGGDMRAELLARGCPSDAETDLAAAERTQAVRDVFDVFRAAGSEVLLTQTLALNAAYLNWCCETAAIARLEPLNQLAARVARSAANESDPDGVAVLGAIGPPGGLLSLEELTAENLRTAYRQQATALCEGGVDGLALLGFTELEALLIAIEAVQPTPTTPVLAGMTFGSGGDFGETAMGATLPAMLSALKKWPLAAVVIDPGEFPDAAPDLIKSAAGLTTLPIAVCLRPGFPVFADEQLTHSDTPVDFSARLAPIATAGARLLLADRGATPKHVAALIAARERLKITGRR